MLSYGLSQPSVPTAAAAFPAMASSDEKAHSSEGKSCLHYSDVPASLSTWQWLDDTLDKCSVSALGRPDNLSCPQENLTWESHPPTSMLSKSDAQKGTKEAN